MSICDEAQEQPLAQPEMLTRPAEVAWLWLTLATKAAATLSTVMTFRLCNTPATFQTFIDTEFGPLIKEGHVVIYLDNILIYVATITELVY